MSVGSRFGGHFVLGHVDGVGRVEQVEAREGWADVWFSLPLELAGLLVPKGSIAVDGVSLTVVNCEPARFSVALIPHTLAATTLGERRPGDLVNLEMDVISKQVHQLVAPHLARLGATSTA